MKNKIIAESISINSELAVPKSTIDLLTSMKKLYGFDRVWVSHESYDVEHDPGAPLLAEFKMFRPNPNPLIRTIAEDHTILMLQLKRNSDKYLPNSFLAIRMFTKMYGPEKMLRMLERLLDKIC